MGRATEVDGHTTMFREGLTSFIDFMFFTHPRCPACGAQHTVAAAYGMPAGPIEEPWIVSMGCVVIEPVARWVCRDCHHEWW